jgi:hypothetical protein
MPTETIKDILDWGRRLHEELATIYQSSSAESEDERTRLLLNYIADHENRLAEMIANFEKHDTTGRVDSWMRDYLEKNPFMAGMREVVKFNPMDGEEVLQATIDAHQKMIAMYRDLAQNAKSDRLETLFTSIADMESNELMRMVMTGERWSDM